MSSHSEFGPIASVAALGGTFLVLGAVVVAASQGGAAAGSAAQGRAAAIERASATTQSVVAPRSRDAMFALALIEDLPQAAQPGNQPGATKLAKQMCNLFPTWGAQQERMTDAVAKAVGQAIGPAQLQTFASAAAVAYCPAQLANARR